MNIPAFLLNHLICESAFLLNNIYFVKVTSLLLGAHADANARDKDQRTPLHFCSQTGHSAVIKVRENAI